MSENIQDYSTTELDATCRYCGGTGYMSAEGADLDDTPCLSCNEKQYAWVCWNCGDPDCNGHRCQ